MKITRSESPQVPTSRPGDKSTTTQQAPLARPAQGAQLSNQVQGMGKASQLLANTPDVDMKKVEQIRSAIAEGKLDLDLDALSRAIVEMHRQ